MVGIPVRATSSNWLLSVDSKEWWKRGWLQVQAEDHLGRGNNENGINQKLDQFLESQGYSPASYPIAYLVTSPRLLNYKFSPASFWYLYSAELKLEAMIAEVNNTFDERRAYFLPMNQVDGQGSKGTHPDHETGPLDSGCPQKFHHAWPKDFHVSPFSSRKGSYALSAFDPVLYNAPQQERGRAGTNAIDIITTLLSSKGHPKLVARLWSNATPLDPATISNFQALKFLASWWWVGLVTFPRIVWEAIILARLRKLHIWYRPEPCLNTVPRHATASEDALASTFTTYLSHILHTAPDSFTLQLSAPTPPSTPKPPESSDPSPLILRTRAATPFSPVFALRVLTPKFFALSSAHHTLASLLESTLLAPHVESRTVYVYACVTGDEEQEGGTETDLLRYLKRAVQASEERRGRRREYGQCPSGGHTRGLLTTTFWRALALLRPWRSAAGKNVYPSPGLPRARAEVEVGSAAGSIDKGSEGGGRRNGGEKREGSRPYFLDEFVREECGPGEQMAYVKAVVMTLLREKMVSFVGGA